MLHPLQLNQHSPAGQLERSGRSAFADRLLIRFSLLDFFPSCIPSISAVSPHTVYLAHLSDPVVERPELLADNQVRETQ